MHKCGAMHVLIECVKSLNTQQVYAVGLVSPSLSLYALLNCLDLVVEVQVRIINVCCVCVYLAADDPL